MKFDISAKFTFLEFVIRGRYCSVAHGCSSIFAAIFHHIVKCHVKGNETVVVLTYPLDFTGSDYHQVLPIIF